MGAGRDNNGMNLTAPFAYGSRAPQVVPVFAILS
jgi:hypothetical protein